VITSNASRDRDDLGGKRDLLSATPPPPPPPAHRGYPPRVQPLVVVADGVTLTRQIQSRTAPSALCPELVNGVRSRGPIVSVGRPFLLRIHAGISSPCRCLWKKGPAPS